MKKLLIVVLVCVCGSLFGQAAPAAGPVLPEGWVLSGSVDIGWSKEVGDGSANEGHYESNNSYISVDGAFSDGIRGQIKLNLPELSDGMDTHPVGLDLFYIEQMWLEKRGVGNDMIRIKAGKMDIPVNQNYTDDLLYTRSFSDGYNPTQTSGFYYSGPSSINYTYGVTTGINLGPGLGEINISTFEAAGGAGAEDHDSGLLESYAVQYNNSENAYGIPGLGMVIGYARMMPDVTGDPARLLMSLGGTYVNQDKGLGFALEYTIFDEWLAEFGTIPYTLTDPVGDEMKVTLISLSVDYNRDPVRIIFTYEQLKGDNETITRLSVFAEYMLAADYSFIFEIADYKMSDWDQDNMAVFAIGFRGKFRT